MFIQTDKNSQYLYDLIETNDCCHKSTKTTEYPYSFAAMMKNSFASVKSFGFRYRLNLAIERAEELGSCFISVGHKRRFCEGRSALGVSSNLVAAQLFLLSANVRLWHKVYKSFSFEQYKVKRTTGIYCNKTRSREKWKNVAFLQSQN